MASWLILLIKQFVDIANYLIIGNSLFEVSFEKHRIKRLIICFVIIIGIYSLYYSYVSTIWINLNVIVCILSLIFIYQDQSYKMIKIISISLLLTTIIEQFVDLFIHYNSKEIISYKFLTVNLCRFLLIAFIAWIIKLIKLINENKYKLIEIPWYIYINIIFGISATLFPLVIVQTYRLNIKSSLTLVIILVAYINIIISFASILLFMKNKKEKDQYFLDSILKDRILKLQEDYYKRLIENYTNVRKFKHDIKGHLNLISGLLNDKNYNKAITYLNEMTESIETKKIYKTSNIYISTILNSFEQVFKKNNIKFEISYYITRTLKIDSMDICSLFYNLLSNSIEANLKLSKNRRYIKLVIADIKNNMIIKIINPVDKDFNLDVIKEYRTTKQDKENHGFGLITINNIVEKYNGNIEYCEIKGMLIIDITLLNVL